MKTSYPQKVLKELLKLYPSPKSELVFSNPYELSISVMLSAQCTDKKVNQVTPELFSKYPCFLDLSNSTITEIEKIIRPINYYKTKSRHLISTATLVSNKFGGNLPQTFEELLELPGIGRKTANVIMGELGLACTIPVDTHVFRVSKRLHLASGDTPLEIENALMNKFPKEQWRELHHTLILHGRNKCKAQKPLCTECKLNILCPNIIKKD